MDKKVEIQAGQVRDAAANNWVDRWSPLGLRPYLRLARVDRPIGIWLLMWPCWWAVALAASVIGEPYPPLRILALFALGALVMRGAGCTYNDIIDRGIDAQVERTKSRPLPSGQLSPRQAVSLMIALSFIGLLIVLQLNVLTLILGLFSLLIVAIYPYMKRLISLPQLVLGVAFSWGSLMGWAALDGALKWPAFLLFFAAFFWTIGYDTIYALQDKEDDSALGLGSTAIEFGNETRHWLAVLYALCLLSLMMAGMLANAGLIFLIGLIAGGGHMAWQIMTLESQDPANCLVRFKSNRDFGALIFIAIVADMTI